jgi:hypothetical protein
LGFLVVLQRVQYARTKSDAAAKLDGSWHRDKRTRKTTLGGGAAAADDTTMKEQGEHR